MECPQCGLFNPPTAELCDCGYNFHNRRPTRPYRGNERLAASDLVLAIALPGVGFVLSLLYVARGKPSAGKVMVASLVAHLFWVALSLAIRSNG